VAFPIIAGYPLVPEKGVQRMSFFREGPFQFEVLTKAHDDNPLTFLRHPVTGRVKQSEHYTIEKPVLAASKMMTLEPGQVLAPVLMLL
jgi:hypothetical protein